MNRTTKTLSNDGTIQPSIPFGLCPAWRPCACAKAQQLHHHLHEPKELPAPYPLSQRLERVQHHPNHATLRHFPETYHHRPQTSDDKRRSDRIGVGELAMMDNSGLKMGTTDGAAGIPYYEKQRQHLKELLNKKKLLEKRLLAQEESIYQKETEYLENTPAGNIITGFDNYTKGTANVAAQRRKTGLTDANRVFSRSSISYNPAAQQESQTPASSAPASHAPTPVLTTFNNKDGTSSAPTPTSATTGKVNNSKKKKATTSGAGVEDSETDSRETKKARTNFGAVRK